MRRLVRNGVVALGILLTVLVVGVLGYRYCAGLAWMYALVNASMILSGMGPVDAITTNGGKWFASAYALFSGVVFLSSVGFFLAPALHRVMHKIHLESEDDER